MASNVNSTWSQSVASSRCQPFSSPLPVKNSCRTFTELRVSAPLPPYPAAYRRTDTTANTAYSYVLRTDTDASRGPYIPVSPIQPHLLGVECVCRASRSGPALASLHRLRCLALQSRLDDQVPVAGYLAGLPLDYLSVRDLNFEDEALD